MKNIWKLFVGDVRRLTSNVVSIIIVIGLVVIPGLFSWFNVSASWDPFANTGNLKFAVANDDEGYKSDLIPVKISIGDQVVNTLRANDQMDWTFTTKKEAIDGTKSGKYYAAVVIPKDFSTRMMTFFTADGDHATLTYYNNEKKNALAPKITGQGADTVAAQINEMFSATLTSTALNIASQLADELDEIAGHAHQLQQQYEQLREHAERHVIRVDHVQLADVERAEPARQLQQPAFQRERQREERRQRAQTVEERHQRSDRSRQNQHECAQHRVEQLVEQLRRCLHRY